MFSRTEVSILRVFIFREIQYAYKLTLTIYLPDLAIRAAMTIPIDGVGVLLSRSSYSPVPFSLDSLGEPAGYARIVFGARVRKEYRAGDARGASWVVPLQGWKRDVRDTRGGSLVGGDRVAVVEVAWWTWKDGVARAFSKLRQPRCRPVVFSPPSCEYRVAIVIGGVAFSRGRGWLLVRCAINPFSPPRFLAPSLPEFWNSECGWQYQ